MAALKNTRHERFAQELAKGKSQAEAYELAGYKASRSAAARLAADVNICERVATMQKGAAERAEITVADIAKQLDEDRAFARKMKSASAAVAATMGKAKVLGLVVDKSQVDADVTFSPKPTVIEFVVPNAGED